MRGPEWGGWNEVMGPGDLQQVVRGLATISAQLYDLHEALAENAKTNAPPPIGTGPTGDTGLNTKDKT